MREPGHKNRRQLITMICRPGQVGIRAQLYSHSTLFEQEGKQGGEFLPADDATSGVHKMSLTLSGGVAMLIRGPPKVELGVAWALLLIRDP